MKTAQENTHLYESVFPNIPQDTIKLYPDFEALKVAPPNMDKVDNLKKIKGHLMLYPLNFLSGETTKFWENFVDDVIYT